MLLCDRIVTQLPLMILWADKGEISALRERYLDKETIRELLKQTSVAFVVADLNSKLKWISIDKRYEFWKDEAQNHIADNPAKISLDDFSDGYAFIASQWINKDKQPIILLEKVH
jgi:hypothetical protein